MRFQQDMIDEALLFPWQRQLIEDALRLARNNKSRPPGGSTVACVPAHELRLQQLQHVESGGSLGDPAE